MRAPAFWWKKAGVAAALLSPLGAIYGAVAGARLARSGKRAALMPYLMGGFPDLETSRRIGITYAQAGAEKSSSPAR